MLPPRIVALPEPGELLENGLRERLLGQRIPALEYPPLARPLRPTKKLRWALRGSILLEFTPVAGGDSLLLLKNKPSLPSR